MSETCYGFLLTLTQNYSQTTQDMREGQGRYHAMFWARQQGLKHEMGLHAIQVINGDKSHTAAAHLMWMDANAAILTRMQFPHMRYVEAPADEQDRQNLSIQF